MLALACQNRFNDLICHSLGVQRFTRKAFEKRSARVALAHKDSANLGGLVVCDELGGETFVEGDGSGFGGRIVDHGGGGEPACQTGDCDDHAVVVLDHVGQELLSEVVVCERVDFEGQVDVLLSAVEDCAAARDTGVVDEHGGVAERGADLRGGGSDGGGRGEIAVEVADGGGC